MASGAIYAPSPALSTWEYGGYPYDSHHPEYTPYPSSGLHPQHSHYQQSYQVWNPPPRYSTGSYPDPSFHGSPPPMRHSLANDPAFARDPDTNPDNWYRPAGTQSAAPFPTRSHSGLDVPHGFVAQANSLHNTSHHAHPYHGDMTGPLSPPQPIYFIPRSVSSSSASDSSTSNAQVNRAPRSSVRSLEYPYEYSDSPTRAIPAIEAPYTPPDEAQSRPRDGKRRPKRRSRRASEHADNQAEEGPGAIIPLAHHPADGTSQTLMSSMTTPPPPSSLAEPPKDNRARTSSRPTPPDLDPIDEMDRTNPYGINVHHKGPYEAVAAILNETNPIDSPLLRAKGIQQQVSAGAQRRPTRHVKVRTVISDPSHLSCRIRVNQMPIPCLSTCNQGKSSRVLSTNRHNPLTFHLNLPKARFHRTTIFVPHAGHSDRQQQSMIQRLRDLHCVATRLFLPQVRFTGRPNNLIMYHPPLHPKPRSISFHTMLTRTFIGPIHRHPSLTRLNIPGLPCRLRLWLLFPLPKLPPPQISTNVLCVHSISPTQMRHPATGSANLGYHQLPRPFIRRPGDDRSGFHVLTTIAFTVASLRSRLHALLRTRRVTVGVHAAPLQARRQPRTTIHLDVSSHRPKA